MTAPRSWPELCPDAAVDDAVEGGPPPPCSRRPGFVAVILEQSFIGGEVFAVPTLIMIGATAAVTAHVIFYSAPHFDLQLLAVVLAVVLVEGVIASMLTASAPNWWEDDLSALGTTSSLSAPTFNVTLIVAGIMVTTLARYVTASIPTSNRPGIDRVRVCLLPVGILLGLVGVFPVDQFHSVHTAFASGMVVAFAALVGCLPWWITEMPRAFAALRWLFIAAILSLAVLVFTRLILFIRNEAALRDDAGTS